MKNILLILIICLVSRNNYGQINHQQSVDSIFSEWDSLNEPGASIGIIQDGQLVYSKGYGSADLEHDVPLTPSSVFYLASVSKHFVTFCILLLEEEGKLNLDDEIQRFLPDFPKYNAPLTIRHFIHHTSGVRDYLGLMYLNGRNYLDNTDVDEVYELIKNQKELNFNPGDRYLYSNSCYFMLAMIVEKASGQSIRDFAHENIFEPLKMNQTLFYDDNTDLIKNRVFSYQRKPKDEGFNNLIMRFDMVGSGGLYSNIEDLYLWDQNFYDNKLGKGTQDLIDKMHEEGLLNNGESSDYAFGLVNGMYKGLKTVSHGGSLAGYRTMLLRFPDQNFSVIILANRSDANSNSMAYEVADIYLKSEFKNEISASDGKNKGKTTRISKEIIKLENLAGNYELRPGWLMEIEIINDSIKVLQTWNGERFQLKNITGNNYIVMGESSVNFNFSNVKDMIPQLITVDFKGRVDQWKRREKVDFSSINLIDYVGQFYAEELNANYEIFLDNDSLFLSIANYEDTKLKPYDVDSFTSNYGLLRFNREHENINGFELDAGRVTNLKFKKQ